MSDLQWRPSKKLVVIAALIAAVLLGVACFVSVTREPPQTTRLGATSTVSARTLHEGFVGNYPLAAVQYGRKPWIVTGRVAGVDVYMTGEKVVSLTDGAGSEVMFHGRIVRTNSNAADQLSEGQQVRLSCLAVNYGDGMVTGANCRIQ